MEPFLWVLFSTGGVVAAFLIPVHIFLFGIAFPLGWLEAPSYARQLALLRLLVTRVYLFVLCSLPLFHWAHRFRYTLYDGLQIKHLSELIYVFSYGGAVLGTALAGYLLWNVH
jgi:fumarate reductase subunit D